MINKIKKFIDYKLLITFLIILLLGMLYLGNYNLVEGIGGTKEEIENKMESDVNVASTKKQTMENIKSDTGSNNKDCSEINSKMIIDTSNEGGAGFKSTEAIIGAADPLFKLCTKNEKS